MRDPLAVRRSERERLLATARTYVGRLSARLPVVAAAVAGSVARGDFNVWSDVDLVVVVEGLPARGPERGALLLEDAPAGVQPVGFTPEEFLAAYAKGSPLAREAAERGVILAGHELFRQAVVKAAP